MVLRFAGASGSVLLPMTTCECMLDVVLTTRAPTSLYDRLARMCGLPPTGDAHASPHLPTLKPSLQSSNQKSDATLTSGRVFVRLAVLTRDFRECGVVSS